MTIIPIIGGFLSFLAYNLHMVCGIYCIKNKKDEKVLVGSSKKIDQRFKLHKYRLNKNNHDNPHLQFAFNIHGMNSFKFFILEPCLVNDLIEKENEWMNKLNSLNPIYGYNMQNATQTFVSKEKKEKTRKNMKHQWDNKNCPNRNKSFAEWRGSDKQKEIMSQRTKARWNNSIERQKMISIRKEFGIKKEFKDKVSNLLITRWSNPEFKKRMSEKRKQMWADPEFKKRMSEIHKKNNTINNITKK